MLKKTVLLLTPLLLCANWQNTLDTVTKATGKTTPQTTTSSSKSSVSQDYASKGLKEALGMGVNQAVSLLGKSDGFLSNSAKMLTLPMCLLMYFFTAVGKKSYHSIRSTSTGLSADICWPCASLPPLPLHLPCTW